MIARIGKYIIEKELGHGGFGDVFLAFDPDFGKKVAIKVLRVKLDSDPDILKRFQYEIRTTASLRHKNIVTILASGVENGNPYLVMEFLEGQNLRDVIRSNQPLTVLKKVEVMTQVAEGLAFAHSKGIVHRDVKPENIMLLPDDSIKIMDFGIGLAPNRRTAMTETSGLVGTLLYFAPEQLEGSKANEQTDIFALGDVYYELLTGQHPFARNKHDRNTLWEDILTYDPPAVSELAPGCPEALESVVHTMIAKDRGIRYATLKEFLLDNKAILVDIRRERAAALLREVAPFVAEGDLQTAMEKLDEAQELDPRNREARQLREQIHRSQAHGRVAELLAESERLMATRRFAEAVVSLELAARLDSSNVTVQFRLGEAKTKLDSSETDARQAALNSQAEIEVQRSAAKRQSEIETIAESIRGCLNRYEIRQAAKELGAGQAKYPGEGLWARIEAEISARQAALKRQPDIANIADEARKPAEAGKFADDDVQFTVFRPNAIPPNQWCFLLAFAHLSDKSPGAPAHEPDPVKEVKRQARAILGEHAETYQNLMEDSSQAVPKAGLLRFEPKMDGVEFNPESYSFSWQKSVHRVQFDLRAAQHLSGQTARGRMTVFLGNVIIAEVGLRIRVDSSCSAATTEFLDVKASKYRRIFASYSHKDVAVVEELEELARAYGDQYIRDVVHLNAGQVWSEELPKLIEDADLFQLFWSSNSMYSEFVTQEWQHAISLSRKEFVRPVYWEEPLPEAPGLPPAALSRLHFQKIRVFSLGADRKPKQERCVQPDGAAQEGEERAAGLRRVLDEAAAAKRQVEIAAVLERARGYLARDETPPAVSELLTARSKYPGDSAWATLEAEIGARQALLKRREDVAAIAESVRVRLERDDLWEAASELSTARAKYPGESLWAALDAAIDARKAALQRQAEIAAIAESVREHLRRDDIRRAASDLAKARSTYPGESPWATLRTELDACEAFLKEQAAMAKVADEARRLADAGKFAKAQQVLDKNLKQYPGLQTVKEEVDRRQREAESEEVRVQAEALLAKGKPGEAVALIESRHAKEPYFQSLLKRARELEARQNQERQESQRREGEDRQAANRKAKIGSHLAAIDSAMGFRDWAAASQELDVAQAQFPDERVFRELRAKVSQAVLREEMEGMASAVTDAFARGDLDEAEQALVAGGKRFSEDPQWRSLQEELRRRRHYVALLAKVEGLVKEGDHASAEVLLRQAIQDKPPDRRAAELLKRVSMRASRAKQSRRLVAWTLAGGVVLGAIYVGFVGHRPPPKPSSSLPDMPTYPYLMGKPPHDLRWTGTLGPGERVDMRAGDATNGSLANGDKVPWGVPGTVRVILPPPPKVECTEHLTSENHYILQCRNKSTESVSIIVFMWIRD